MTNTITILGSGAAPGVPSLSDGFGVCDSNNQKNYRTRTTTYYQYNGNKFLIDTSPDLRLQILNNNIRELNAVLYTHSHADHLHGIDDLREINRVMQKPLNIYAAPKTLNFIKKRFSYLISKNTTGMVTAALVPNKAKHNKPFYINELKVVAVPLIGHIAPSVAYVFNDGEVVHISDCKEIDNNLLKAIKTKIKVLIMPLTNPYEHAYHMGLEKLQEIAQQLNPEKVIINHMSTHCDYDEINKLTDNNIYPSFDGMKVEF